MRVTFMCCLRAGLLHTAASREKREALAAPRSFVSPTDQALVEAGHDNFVEAYALLARAVPGGHVEQFDGLTLVATGLDDAEFNRAFVLSTPVDPAAALRRAASTFKALHLPWMLVVAEQTRVAMTGPATAQRLGFGRIFPVMALDPLAGHEPRIAGFEVSRVDGGAMATVFADTLAEGFGNPRSFTRIFAEPGAWDALGVVSYIGWCEGRPVATASRVVTEGVAGIYNVCTAPGFRRRGFGAAITWRAALDGLADGCEVSLLQSSNQGYSVYREMGYRKLTSYRAWYRARAEG